MSYLLTNNSALTALQNLTMTQQSLATTQTQLSTGLAINSAADNASYWSIAQTMSSDNGALGAVASSLKVSGSMVSTFTSALQQSISVVNNIKNDLVEAQTSGANLAQIGSDITNQQNSLTTITNGATFNGQNWLNGTTASANIADAYTNSGGVSSIAVSAATMSQIQLTGTGGILATTQATGGATNVMGITVGATDTSTTLTAKLSEVNAALTSMENAAQYLGSYSQTITQQQNFVSAMQTNLTSGVGSLVDADMNQVSTRLQALQTQQQLGVQSLSIANQSSSMILKLFQ
jgi:flagellin